MSGAGALAGHAGMLWHRAGHALEGLQWCRKVLAVAGPDADAHDRAGVELTLAHLAGVANSSTCKSRHAARPRARCGKPGRPSSA